MEIQSVNSCDFQRTAVVGTSCSGKTTFARELAAILGVPHIELDALFWLPGWKETPIDEFRTRVEQETCSECWVVDGNYSQVRDIVWSQATGIIWLNYSFPLVFWQALKRTIRRAFTRQELFSGNRESFRKTFFSHDSILLWVLKSFRKNRLKYTNLKDSPDWQHLHFTEFRHPSQATSFLSQVANTSRLAVSSSQEIPDL
ncbi:MAG: hypothetical protein ABIJ65_04275 [Chloroflexota bacterium]